MLNSIKADIKEYYRLWFRTNSIYEKWAKEHGITTNTLFVLFCINENTGTCTQKRISESFLLPKQTVNAALKEIEIKGYIKRITNEKDKRSKIIVFTDEGSQYASRLLEELSLLEEDAFSMMETSLRLEMLNLNNLLLKNLELAFETKDRTTNNFMKGDK